MKQSKIVESLYSKYRLNESLYATNIDWCVEEEDVDYADDPEQEVENVLAGLPTRVEIPQDVADEYYHADSDYDSEIITDYLSDTYGWLVYGCDIEFLESYGRKSKKSIKESHRRRNRKPLKEGAQHANHIKKILNSVADYLDSTYSNCSAITDGDNLKISENGFEETYNLSYALVPVYTLSTPLDGIVFAYANENDLYPITDGQRLYGLNDNSTVSYIVNLVRDDIINSR